MVAFDPPLVLVNPPDWLLEAQQRNPHQTPEVAKAQADAKYAEHMTDVSRNFREAKETEERIQLRKMNGQSLMFPFRKPRDLLRQAAPPPFAFDEVPLSIATAAYHISQARGSDPSGVIVACVTAAASVIDDRYKLTIRPESNWHVSARQWSFLCGGPSTGKSPAIRAASGHIKTMHGILHERWRDANEGKSRNEQEPAPALYTSDTNVPALSDRLRGNPRGLLMLTEEFASWIGAIDTSDKGDAAKNRGDWLQLRDGGPHQIDRVERGSMFVPNWGVSVLSACTPDGLAKQMKQMPEDGLIQRFIPCILATPSEKPSGDSRQAEANWGSWLEGVYAATTRMIDSYIYLSPQARQMFDDEADNLRQLIIATEQFAPSYAAHLGKHPGMLGEVALVFSVFSSQNGHLPTEVSAESMGFAIRYLRKARKHAHTLYASILSASPAYELARALARSLAAADEAMTTLGRDWMSKHCMAFRKADERLQREGVQLLVDADWLEPQTRTYQGWPSSYSVNPQVFTIYAREGEMWRARRAAVKDAIGDAE